jgi:signal peptidase I
MTRTWLVAVVALWVAAIAAVLLLNPVFKRYRVPSESMEPTIHRGDTVNLNGGESPAVGDIVIFHPPVGAETAECGQARAGAPCARPTPERAPVTYIKRIVAGPGDRVAFEAGNTIRNGKRASEPYIAPCRGVQLCELPAPITVPDGMYFLVGDNRGASDDSRVWGPVPEDWILGRAERCHVLYFACSRA